jgi:hypothetical protein
MQEKIQETQNQIHKVTGIKKQKRHVKPQKCLIAFYGNIAQAIVARSSLCTVGQNRRTKTL